MYRKELIGAANAAFSIGNNWAFAHRNRFRVKGLRLREQGLALKEQDRRVKVKDHHLKEKSPGNVSFSDN